MSSNVGDEDEDGCVLVIDSGSGVTKAGFAGDDAPRVVYNSMIGRPKHKVFMNTLSTEKRSEYVGELAVRERDLLALTYPIDRGIVKNWDDMERFWHHTFYSELRVAPEEADAVLLTEPPMNPKFDREKSAELMFETFEAQGLNVSLQPVLSLTASGRHEAIILEIGEGLTTVTPLKGVYGWPRAVRRYHFGGKDVTEYFAKLLAERGHYFHTSDEKEIVREMKEKLAYVAEDFDAEMKKDEKSKEATFELSDGHVITMGDERFRCTEPFFRPEILGLEQPGLAEMVYKAIMATDINARRHLYVNIILSGGSTMFPGMAERLEKEVRQMVPSSMKVKVVSNSERFINVWIGGSIIGSLSSFSKNRISRQEYHEHGPNIVHSKFGRV